MRKDFSVKRGGPFNKAKRLRLFLRIYSWFMELWGKYFDVYFLSKLLSRRDLLAFFLMLMNISRKVVSNLYSSSGVWEWIFSMPYFLGSSWFTSCSFSCIRRTLVRIYRTLFDYFLRIFFTHLQSTLLFKFPLKLYHRTLASPQSIHKLFIINVELLLSKSLKFIKSSCVYQLYWL